MTDDDIQLCKNYFPKRYKKAQNYKFDDDKKRSYGVSVLFYRILNICEKNLYYTENQKLYAENIEFNISHSGDYVVLCYDNDTVGVDIEKIGKYHSNVAKRVFTQKEQEWLCDDKNKFYQLWTLKESVMKATGLGLKLGANSFEVLHFFDNEPIIINGISYYGITTKYEDYYISICQTKPIQKINIEKIN